MQYRPRPQDLQKLKTPLGQLLPGPPGKTIPTLKHMIEKDKPPMVAAVGDVVSKETFKAGVKIQLRIVDNRSMRTDLPSERIPAGKTYTVKNPAGVITMEAWKLIQKVVHEPDSLIIVEGEEDLLVLPVTVEAPEHSFVLYGQPREGLVVVEASMSMKKQVKTILDHMDHEESS